MAIPVDWGKYLQSVSLKPELLIDVRSPGEYILGHVPGAYNMPLFDDDERAEVGTLYKQQGNKAAVRAGLAIIGPKLADFIKEVDKQSSDNTLAVHCWRGGMRSGSVAKLLELAGYEVSILTGGYKAYRNVVLETFGKAWDLRVLSGRTGSGKTDILLEMKHQGAQVIDLEGLANHKGSAFGGLMQPDQPSQQNFEHALFNALRSCDASKPIWLEDESLSIGRIYIPKPLWDTMKLAPIKVVDMPTERRVKRLVADYADASNKGIEESLLKIQKRLGGQRVKEAQQALQEGDFHTGARIALHYYDRAYDKSLVNRSEQIIQRVDCGALPIAEIASMLFA